ncbi:MAG: VWA domain-containing protein [Planctomycetes bacterium]|nr:VWA domain-containing protein [Planctomycetota bacterium]
MGHFLYPLAFVFAGVLPLVVLLYILKLKRKEYVVSSTFLWRKSIEDLRVNAPFQKLRKNLMLFIQLLLLTLLIFAMARPFLKMRGFEGQTLILLLDTSASMQATDVAPSRFEFARRTALTMVDDLSRGDKMMLISFDAKASILCSLTTDRALLRATLRGLEPKDTRTALREALVIARSVAQAQEHPAIVILSDGAFPDVNEDAGEKAKAHFVAIGERCKNVALTALEARKSLEIGAGCQVLARVENFRAEPAEVLLELSLDGRLLDVRTVKLGPGDRRSEVFERRDVVEGVLHARINVEDDLAVDNQAWCVLQKEQDIRLLAVTEGNYFLEKVLRLDPAVKFERTSPKDFAAMPPDRVRRYDVIALDAVTPEKLPDGNFLCFNCVPPLEGLKSLGPASYPVILDWKRAHPLTRFVNFSNLDIREAAKLVVPKWGEVVLESDQTPLIAAFSKLEQKVVVIGFDIYASDWPLRLSFPIFVSNTLQWLSGHTGQSSARQVAAGDVLAFVPDRETVEITIVNPQDKAVTEKVGEQRRILYGGTDKVGVYRVKPDQGAELPYAVNLLSPAESNLAVRAKLTLGEAEVTVTKEAVVANREIWGWLALVAFGILMVEWLIYHRRVWV